MSDAHLTRHLGHLSIDRIIESELPNFDPLRFFPHTNEADWAPLSRWLSPHPGNPRLGWLTITMQSFLVRTRRHTILIDTCVGDHKNRQGGLTPANWHQTSDGTLLKNLARAGVDPLSVDYVMCTHLHPDHVGWNTRLENGRWVPTFPNAKYVISKAEFAAATEAFKGRKTPEHFIDSVLPVVEAGQAQFVGNDYALDDEVWFESTPGHSADHVSIRLSSKGEDVVVTGDLMHSPLQCAHHSWHPRFDADPVLASHTRLEFLKRYCDTPTLVCGTHFPSPSFGRIVSKHAGFEFDFNEPA